MLTKFNFYTKLFALNEISAADDVDMVAYNKVRRCFTQIITNYGFFAELLFQLNMIEANKNSGVDTMATDGKSIAYSPEFVKQLTEAEVTFVIIHEIMHNANFHFNRQGSRDHGLWNEAADYAINIQIDDMRKESKKTNISPPKGILLDEKYRDMNAEMIYDILEQQKKNGKSKPGQGTPGQGTPGQGKPGQGGGTPAGDIRAPGSLDGKGKQVYKGNSEFDDIKSAEDLEKKWQEVRNNAASKNAGTGSASMDRWLRKVNKPKINWRSELKKFVAQVFDQLDYGFFNKRFIAGGDYLPGPKLADTGSYENVVIAIDTSGSISDDTLGKFASEMLKLFKLYSIKKCHIVWCDSEISSVQTFDVDSTFKIEKLKPSGGGGTSFKPPFKWIQQNILKKGKTPAFVIYFTDAFGDAPTPGEYGIRGYHNRVLWVVTENDNADHIKFGKKIYIDKIPG